MVWSTTRPEYIATSSMTPITASRTANDRGRGPSSPIAIMLTSMTPPHAYAT